MGAKKSAYGTNVIGGRRPTRASKGLGVYCGLTETTYHTTYNSLFLSIVENIAHSSSDNHILDC